MYQVLYQVLKAVFFDELSLQLKIWYAIARDEIIQPQIGWYLVSNVAHKSTFVNVALHIIHTNILSNENAEWPNINQSHKWVSGRLCLFVVYFWLWQMIHQWRKKLIPINQHLDITNNFHNREKRNTDLPSFTFKWFVWTFQNE